MYHLSVIFFCFLISFFFSVVNIKWEQKKNEIFTLEKTTLQMGGSRYLYIGWLVDFSIKKYFLLRALHTKKIFEFCFLFCFPVSFFFVFVFSIEEHAFVFYIKKNI